MVTVGQRLPVTGYRCVGCMSFEHILLTNGQSHLIRSHDPSMSMNCRKHHCLCTLPGVTSPVGNSLGSSSRRRATDCRAFTKVFAEGSIGARPQLHRWRLKSLFPTLRNFGSCGTSRVFRTIPKLARKLLVLALQDRVAPVTKGQHVRTSSWLFSY